MDGRTDGRTPREAVGPLPNAGLREQQIKLRPNSCRVAAGLSSQRGPRSANVLYKPKVRCRVHKSAPLVPVLSQMTLGGNLEVSPGFCATGCPYTRLLSPIRVARQALPGSPRR